MSNGPAPDTHVRRTVAAVFAFAALLAPLPALAQNPAAGQALYRTFCLVCHSPVPATAIAPFNQIMSAANNPAQITAAAEADPAQMGFIPSVLTAGNLADIAAYLGTFTGAPAPVAVVEFYNAARDHYFISTAIAEIADLDGGVHPGWTRTGRGFNAFANATSGASPVCRFYVPPANGDSHFYSASPVECAQVAAAFPAFTLESTAVFHIGLPDPATGGCAPGTVQVYRIWDQRADTNHRYTTSNSVRQQMLAQGWIAEGYGPDRVIMCAPQ